MILLSGIPGWGSAPRRSSDHAWRDKTFLYTQKTGTPVRYRCRNMSLMRYTSPSDDPRYLFWNGQCRRTSAVKIWETTFKTVFKKADVEDGHIHRFRDTFAVQLLEKGVPIEAVSVLLGHSNIAITLKHYHPW